MAHGEVTGHHHSVPASAGTLTLDEGGVMYLTIDELTASPIDGVFPIRRWQRDSPVVLHPDWGETAFAAADCDEVATDHIRVSGRFAPVVHQEHAAEALRPGTYRVTRQREWTDQDEPRQVAD